MYFYVNLDYFGLMLLVTFCWVGLCFFHYRAKRLAGKNVSETTYFVSSGTEKTMLPAYHAVDASAFNSDLHL